MFAFISQLVETTLIETVNVNFLIVGHTHTNIDQYFSVVTKKLLSKRFIGSPASLLAVYEELNPGINRQIKVYYDYKTYYDNVINLGLHHYQLPHVFLFSRLGGSNRCHCRHKPYSTSSEYLPRSPIDSNQDLKILKSVDFEWSSMDGFGSKDVLVRTMLDKDFNSTVTISDLVEKNFTVNLAQTTVVFDHLRAIEINAVAEQVAELEYEANNGPSCTATNDAVDDREDKTIVVRNAPRHIGIELKQKQDISKYFQRPRKSPIEGYIFWLDYERLIDSDWLKSFPKPISYSSDVSGRHSFVFI